MAARFAPGDRVGSAFGKGIVRDVRNSGRVLVDVRGRSFVVDAGSLVSLSGTEPQTRHRTTAPPRDRLGWPGERPAQTSLVRECDLHGFTVDEAIERVDQVIDRAIREEAEQVRLIHGRSGGRLRHALHTRLRAIPTVRAFALDPRNPGVTIVRF